jgi:hypothetical protein
VKIASGPQFAHLVFVAAIAGAALCAFVSVAVTAPVDAPHAAAYRVFDRYVQLTEERVSNELRPSGAFLNVDALNADEREAAYRKLRAGEVRIETLTTLDRGQKIPCPGCMIQHWVGIVFIPGATLEQTLRFVRDYDHHAEYFAPEVTRATILSRGGDDYRVFMRFRRTKVVTVVLDTEHNVHYQRIDDTRASSRSVSTRIQEVEDAGKSTEHALPEGKDNGYLWRINNYWRFVQRDGGANSGIYVQCESVSLSRDIPAGLGWLIGPLVESIPQESLRFTLEGTRRGVLAAQNPPAHH